MNGRPVMQERPGSEFELPCELVLLALGFLGPELDTVIAQLGCELTDRGNLKAEPDYQTTVPACSRAATRGGASRSSRGRSGRASPSECSEGQRHAASRTVLGRRARCRQEDSIEEEDPGTSVDVILKVCLRPAERELGILPVLDELAGDEHPFAGDG